METASSDYVMKRYYRERAPVYDPIYKYLERREDVRYPERHIPNQFTGRDVIGDSLGTLLTMLNYSAIRGSVFDPSYSRLA